MQPEHNVVTAIDQRLDITAEICPMTFVRTRLALDRMEKGQVLEVLLRGDEPRRNVSQSVVRLGHAIVECGTDDAGLTRLVVRRR